MQRGFTLLELSIAIFLAMLIVAMAVPSLTSVLDGQKEEEGFEAFNALVQGARLRSMEERKPWALEWQSGRVVLRPLEGGEEAASLEIGSEESLTIRFPAAMVESPEAIWAFWPSGNCEAAEVLYQSAGENGWSASYHPLTAQPEVTYTER